MKIFSYIGSRNPTSRTNRITEEILKKISDTTERKIDYEVHTPLTTPLSHSTGCKSCFNQGFCPQDKNNFDDYMINVKNKMIDSDIIFISSPVHSHNVSSDIKILIDRLSYWTHIFKLAGKKIIILVTAESNGAHFVVEYIDKVFSLMGGEICYSVAFLNSEIDLREEIIEDAVSSISSTIDENYAPQFTEKQEAAFSSLKLIMQSSNKELFEYNYWKKNRLLEFDSLTSWYNNV